MENLFDDLASEIIDELGHDFEQKLIAAIKQFRCIYARDDPDYYNMQQNRIGWIRIAHTLKKPVAECMGKWYFVLDLLFNAKRDDQKWIHHQSLQEMQPYLSQTYAEMQNKKMCPPPKPTVAQKHIFMNELLLYRTCLLSNELNIEQRREIWRNIVDKVNAVPNGVKMPIISWQKYWWDQKQNFGVQSAQIRARLQLIGTKLDVSKYSAEDLMILKFYGVTYKESTPIISALLNSNVEFGSDGNNIPERCKKCTVALSEQMPFKFCETCRKMPPTLCDICSKRHEPKLTVHKVKNWSLTAKNLLPTAFHSYAELSACTLCSLNLEKLSSQVWKACRVCENYNNTLDNLFLPAYDNMRKIFKDATNNVFSEYDGLPGYICKACKIQMQQFNNFFLRFDRTQTRLRIAHAEQFVGVAPSRPVCKPKIKPLPNPKVSANNIMIIKPGQSPKQMPPQNGNTPTKKPFIPPTGMISCRSIKPGQVTSPEGHNPKENQVKLQGARQASINSTPVNTTKVHTTAVSITPSQGQSHLSPRTKVVQQIISKPPSTTDVAIAKSMSVTTVPRGLPIFSAKSGISVTKKIVYSNSATGTGAVTPVHSSPTYTHSALSTSVMTLTTPVRPTTTSTTISTPAKMISPKVMPHPIAKPTPGPQNVVPNHVGGPQTPFNKTQPITQTIPVQDFEEDDSPPAYCIPKSLTLFRNSQTSVKIMRTTPKAGNKEPVPSPNPPTIKIEKINDGYEDISSPPTQPPIQSQPPASVNTCDPNPRKKLSNTTNPVVRLNQMNQDNRKTMPLRAQQNQSASGPPCKRARKNWGYVHEFQISSVTDKTNTSAQRIQQRRMTVHNTSVVHQSLSPITRSQTPEQLRPSTGIQIKEEPVDDYQNSSANDTQSPVKDTNPSMFYPDSFELEKLSLSVDVTSMLNHMLDKQKVLDTDNLTYLIPPFPESYAEKKLDEATPAKAEQPKDTIDKETTKPVKSTQPTVPTIRFPIKNLRIKVKRLGRSSIRKKTGGKAPNAVITRKSSRRKSNWHNRS